MVKKPNVGAKARPPPDGAGASAAADPSKANASSPGSVKTPKFKKRKVRVNREKAAAAVGAGTVGGDALASASTPQPAATVEASPVVRVPKPATDAEGSVPAPTPATAEASAAKPKLANTDAAAAAASSKGKRVSDDNSGGDGKMKNRKERAKERAMNGKGKEKEMEEDGGRKGKGNKAVGRKEGRGDSKGAGFIFMCNAQTKQECYQNQLFGLPNGKLGMVKKIRPGAKLFLYDFDLKLLYGVYKATSNGGLNLVREAFQGKFPAQVKFKVDRDCLPLRETSFKHAIKENYRARSKFDPELSSKQLHRLIALFKPVNVPQSVPNNHHEDRRHYEERRQPYHFEERRPSLPIEEVRQPRFDDERRPGVIHVPLEDPYRAQRFAPLPIESQLGRSLAGVHDDHHIYYQPAHLAPEPRHIPLALESRHIPLALERQHVHYVPEPRHVPSVYYQNLASSDDSYYRSVVDVPKRFADRTVADRTARDPRDHTSLPGELSARTERLEELYLPGGVSAHGAHVEELYRPGEHAVRADHVGITTRADRLEELYRSDQLVTRATDLPRHSTYLTPAYAEPSQRPARANAPGGAVSSLYSFSSGPIYQ